MTTQSVNIEAIKVAASKSKARMALMDIWSERQRGRFEQSLPRAMRLLKDRGIAFDASDISSFFKELEKANAGAIVGAKDYPRFVFNAHLISIVKAAGFNTPLAIKKIRENLLPVTPMRTRRAELPKIDLAALDKAAPMPSIKPTAVQAKAPTVAPKKTIRVSVDGVSIDMPLDLSSAERDVVLGMLKSLA